MWMQTQRRELEIGEYSCQWLTLNGFEHAWAQICKSLITDAYSDIYLYFFTYKFSHDAYFEDLASQSRQAEPFI